MKLSRMKIKLIERLLKAANTDTEPLTVLANYWDGLTETEEKNLKNEYLFISGKLNKITEFYKTGKQKELIKFAGGKEYLRVRFYESGNIKTFRYAEPELKLPINVELADSKEATDDLFTNRYEIFGGLDLEFDSQRKDN